MVPSHARMLRHSRVSTSYPSLSGLPWLLSDKDPDPAAYCRLLPSPPVTDITQTNRCNSSLVVSLCPCLSSTDRADVMTKSQWRLTDLIPSLLPPNPNTWPLIPPATDKKCVKIIWLCDVESVCVIYSWGRPPPVWPALSATKCWVMAANMQSSPHNMHSRDHVQKWSFGALMVYFALISSCSWALLY